MATTGTAFFNSNGQIFRTAEDATISDLASLIGRGGCGESLAPGLARLILEKRADLERIFAEHDAIMREHGSLTVVPCRGPRMRQGAAL
ncbi:hypothetical protein [Novosphingobium sp. TH158]|uniref:hypothetical protein n=1 Tax=Novosphingobium sp. TH158 TaxID=2067455 RepID=UPI000C7C2542|nr:hypothetical protein [Novosphingobium sp. TH158]PLK25952.1 hypothetical protein C0V78_02890 [Novosphingobium sp. TH158]